MFGAGLTLSGMVDPTRVLGFLDVAGVWDPTLAFVLGGALIPSAAAYAVSRRMRRPVMAEEFCIPRTRSMEGRLIGGAALFGIGWGLVGLCPGPAITNLAFGRWQIRLFGAAMAGGMLVQRLYADARDRRTVQVLEPAND
jgi:uncharacterized membrane protein YedE/YeeE